MGKLLEIKETMRLNECRNIEDTDLYFGVFNFSDGTVHEYTFVVQYVRKVPYGSGATEQDYPNHVVNAYGVIKYDSGESYNVCHKLTYTRDEELEKLIEPIKKGKVGDFFEETRKYI
jgi:hypothetical protein